MSQHFGLWESDCGEDEQTLDLADHLIAGDGVIDLAEYRLIRARLQDRVARSADRMELIREITATLKLGDEAPRVIRLRGERARFKRRLTSTGTYLEVLEGGLEDGEDDPQAA